MIFIADVHLHSYYSRATSKNLNLENLNYWAQLKGVTVVGTADFTHPAWFEELSTKLEDAEPGLFRLKREFAQELDTDVPESCRADIRFMLTVEISSIYKKNDKTRKVHNVVFMPSLPAAAKFSSELAKIGNIASDGRPILGLDCRDLLEIVLETDDDAFLVPAHIWTPHFAVLGAASGFESIDECFEDLTPHIFAVESGLSSDPPMNWRLSQLDRYTLISNSDAHSPPKLLREANVFDAELSYFGIKDTWKSGDPERWLGTIEFFPQEGKYHLDGHRKCQQRLTPGETRRNEGLCPVCGKKVTVGVSSRIDLLADREEGFRPPNARPFQSLVPLPEVIGEVLRVGEKSKRVEQEYFRLLHRFGNEYSILTEAPLEQIAGFSSPLLARAIEKMRKCQVEAVGGYDGEYGVILTLTEEDRQENEDQLDLFSQIQPQTLSPLLEGLNPTQEEAVVAAEGPTLILAGAGTGKTNTLARRLAYAIDERNVPPDKLLAVTFTQKAAEEIRERVDALLGEPDLARACSIGTVHSFSAHLLREFGEPVGVPSDYQIAGPAAQRRAAEKALNAVGAPDDVKPSQFLDALAGLKARGHRLNELDQAAHASTHSWGSSLFSDSLFYEACAAYQALLASEKSLDFEDLILKATEIFEHSETGQKVCRRFSSVLVDEAQDLNESQYRWLLALAAEHRALTLVGDPDQSIYSFRGANARIFHRFIEDFPQAHVFRLEENYRCPDTVLTAAEQLLASDEKRMEKRLFTQRSDGRKVQLWEFDSSRLEATRVVQAIEEMVEETSMERRDEKGTEMPYAGIVKGFGDIAILTRTNAQHFAFAEALNKAGIPFQAAAAVKKKTRPEIREILAQLRLTISREDDSALEHLLLSRVQGIGEKTVASLKNFAHEMNSTLFEAMEHDLKNNGWPVAKEQSVREFIEGLDVLRTKLEQKDLPTVLNVMLAKSRLLDGVSSDPDALFLKLLATRFQGLSLDDRIVEFLNEASLRFDSDLIDPRGEYVKLLTIHASKGLEFPAVFVCGVEEGLLPVPEALSSDDVIDEERRLLYVAMTRTREFLVLTHCRQRFIYGDEREVEPSRFIESLPVDDFDCHRFERRISKRQLAEQAQLSLF